MPTLEVEICWMCLCRVEGEHKYRLERFWGDGEAVPLCDDCGGTQSPTLAECYEVLATRDPLVMAMLKAQANASPRD